MRRKVMSDAASRNRKAAMLAIEQAIIRIEENRGKEGNRLAYDKALQVFCAIKNAGLRLVKVKGGEREA